jgi:hypothetical protein
MAAIDMVNVAGSHSSKKKEKNGNREFVALDSTLGVGTRIDKSYRTKPCPRDEKGRPWVTSP